MLKENIMSKFLKHIGAHGDRKVAVVFRQIPDEEHMCLVVYTQLLNQNIHDPLMSVIESDIGQNSKDLADALNRTHTKDGKIILHVLHKEGMLKKLNTEHVMMTPLPNQRVRLDELNTILNEMEQGEEAVKRLAEIDASRGLQDPKDIARRMRDAKEQQSKKSSVQQPASGLLDDNSIANSLRQQAERMNREAQGLMAEANRLLKEAAEMSGTTHEHVHETIEVTTPKKRAGRPKKVAIG